MLSLQMSLNSDMDPKAHIELGRALSPLRDEGVLILGSGSSYHNMGELRRSFANGMQGKALEDAQVTWL
jgi:aromatic ring-opening dioxygenase catalytic subunit (LigB family)